MKRYYHKVSSWSYATTLETKLKIIPVALVFTDQLKNETIEPNDYKTKFVQIRKSSTYADLKKRIADVVSNKR